MEEQFLKEWNRLRKDLSAKNFILAISGGVDSVVLARLLASAEIPFAMAHCNFKLRGPASDRDEAFLSDLAKELDVTLHRQSFATEEYAREHGISIQMAARELRYSWFNQLMDTENSYLLLAHHANDVAETMLFNVTKGTGIAGLHGIQAVDGKVIRPMLWAKKEEILAYAQALKLNWCEDSSNTDTKYARNRIRSMVIPELQKINPAFIEAAERTAHRISDTEKLIDYVLNKEQLTSWQGRHLFLDKDKLRFLPGQASLLFRLLSPFGFNYDQVDSILGSMDSVGAIFSSKEATLNIDRQAIIVSPVSTALVPVQITTKTKHFTFNGRRYLCRKISRADFILRKEPFIAAFDFDKLEFPLVMRAYREGERFQPLGMQGKKLISDFLIDEKIPVSLKREQAVIESGGQLAWLVERRIDDRFKVIESTKSIFEISPAGA